MSPLLQRSLPAGIRTIDTPDVAQQRLGAVAGPLPVPDPVDRWGSIRYEDNGSHLWHSQAHTRLLVPVIGAPTRILFSVARIKQQPQARPRLGAHPDWRRPAMPEEVSRLLSAYAAAILTSGSWLPYPAGISRANALGYLDSALPRHTLGDL